MMFIPVFVPPLSHVIAGLLLSDKVQNISFYFGHVHVLPQYFREVAGALVDGRITVSVDPTAIPAGFDAKYHGRLNRMFVKENGILATPAGRATVVHEASHAVADSRGKDTAIRQEEAAGFVCEAWYLDSCGIDSLGDHNVSEAFFSIATALKSRAKPGSPAAATASEINDGRAEAASYGYKNDYYRNDGF